MTRLLDGEVDRYSTYARERTDTLTAAAQVLGMDVGQVEVLCVDLIAAGMVERARRQ